MKELEEVLVLGLRDYVEKSGFSQVTVASSGGVDSALVCKLACDAFGPEKVHAVRMPLFIVRKIPKQMRSNYIKIWGVGITRSRWTMNLF